MRQNARRVLRDSQERPGFEGPFDRDALAPNLSPPLEEAAHGGQRPIDQRLLITIEHFSPLSTARWCLSGNGADRRILSKMTP